MSVSTSSLGCNDAGSPIEARWENAEGSRILPAKFPSRSRRTRHMSLPGHDIRFILSAGRTGTVFLTHRLGERFEHLLCVHEPSPSRAELVLANFRNRFGFGETLLRSLFTSARRRRLDSLEYGEQYLEINPLLCPLADMLHQVEPLRIVHLVREPASWAQSIVNFKARGWRRGIIDYVPFTKPYPWPRPAGWNGMTEFEKALWRWRFCNESILQLRPSCDRYVHLRYEDLFSRDEEAQRHAVGRLLRALGLPDDDDLEWLRPEERLNASERKDVSPITLPSDRVESICGDLMTEFGYTSERASV